MRPPGLAPGRALVSLCSKQGGDGPMRAPGCRATAGTVELHPSPIAAPGRARERQRRAANCSALSASPTPGRRRAQSGTRDRSASRHRPPRAHQRREAKALLVADAELSVFAQHSLIATQLLAVGSRSSEDLGPPGGHIAPMLLVHTARKERRQQLVLLDAVEKRVDHPIERFVSTSPLVERRVLAHDSNVRACP